MTKKILFITEDYICGGVATVSQTLKQAINLDCNYQMDIGLLNSRNDYAGFKPVFILNQHEAKNKVMKLFRLFSDSLKLSRKISGYDIIIVNGDLFQVVIPVWIFSLFKKIRVIAWVHACLDKVKYYPNQLIKSIHCIGLKSFTQIVCVSHESARSLAAYAGAEISTRIEVIYNPFIITELEKALPIADLDNRKIKIIVLGRLVAEKNFALLIRALSMLQNKNLQLIICGEGSEKNALIEEAIALNVYEQLLFVGQTDNPLGYIAASDILVSTSTTEALPSVIIEALALSKVIIATDTGAREILTHGCGVIIPVNEPAILAQAIEKVINDELLRKQLIQNRHLALKPFMIENVIPYWLKTFARLFENDAKNLY
ncbi:glycosyltransferase [Aquella oligotrophica]|uniref:Glycosyl transferase family 1 domain-containing protein n=1 Tax=Aquella oligotrophica TaxID=2067065 RepID=A0A2I7N5T6_9NEIS|nr:glycosyltransferase [Aquella oligotrophica]AUR51585.1 hypothetical protein CUN60_04535 [Aquella oligotrophica]